MPYFVDGEVSIHFEVHGDGFPVLLFAPGAMNSAIELWSGAAINPLRTLRDDFQLIAMDQRNAGRSTGPLELDDPWGAYARDQLALLDHLGVDRFHVLGCCIGVSFAFTLAQRAPDRLCAAVLEQPVGVVADNRPLYEAMWRAWADQLLAHRQDITRRQIEAFATTMWEGDFVLSVTREALRRCTTPLLVLPGVDRYHPTATGREIAALAPNARLLDPWKDADHVDGATAAVRDFLRSRTPSHQSPQPSRNVSR